MTQAVGYVSGRSELLCALFMLTSFLCLHAWLFRRGAAWLVAGIASWMLALASKEVAVMLPVVLLVYGRLLLPREDGDIRQRLARVYIPMLAFVAVAGAARLFVFAGVENVSRASFSWSNILVGLDVVRRYTALVFMTAPQSIFHSALQPSSILRPIVILDALWMIALAVLAWRVYLRAPLVSFGALWFVLMLLPSASMLILDIGEPMAEQRAYVAGGGFAMATGAAFARLRTWPASHRVSARAVVTVTFGLLLVMMALPDDRPQRGLERSRPPLERGRAPTRPTSGCRTGDSATRSATRATTLARPMPTARPRACVPRKRTRTWLSACRS